MHPISLNDVIEHIGKHIARATPENLEEVNKLLWDALNQYDQNPHLWHYAGWYFNHVGNHAVAAQCLKRCYELESNPLVLSNLGKTYKSQQDPDKASKILEVALDRLPEDPDVLATAAVCYVAEGNPQPGVELAERSLAIKDDPEVRFNCGLLNLEAGNFARGFELYATGKHRWRGERKYEPDPPVLTPELHERLTSKLTPIRPTLLVYGEQGIGDEIMFSTLLRDVAEDYGKIIFDCHPRLVNLHNNSNWARETDVLTPTRKERGSVQNSFGADAKVSIGNLCQIYRRSIRDFENAWWFSPLFSSRFLERETARYRAHLKEIAGNRKIVGLAMRGGTFHTSTKHRRLSSDAIKELMAHPDYFFVGLDYEDMMQTAAWIQQDIAPHRYWWPTAVNFAWDYAHVAALVLATDAVVSVPQSVAHLSAALGHPTYVLNPIQTAWREAGGDYWYWYGMHAVMLRASAPGKWPIKELLAELETLHG